MKLTMQTDFALRTLMYLSTCTERIKITEISNLFGISNHHLAKVVNQLSRFGYIRSVRGAGGGIELACSPKEILVGEVIERFEGSLHLLDCIDTPKVCVIQEFCKLKNVLSNAEQIMLDYLKSVSLEDISPSRKKFEKIKG